MKRKTTMAVTIGCLAIVAGILGLADIAAAQSETPVYIGKGAVLHRSNTTLILDVEEGPKGPGIRKVNVKSTDGLTFKDRLGNPIEVFDLKAGDFVTAYRLESVTAPVTITMTEVEQIKAAEPAAAPRPTPAPAPEPAPVALPSTASQLPFVLLLGVLSLVLGLALRARRVRA